VLQGANLLQEAKGEKVEAATPRTIGAPSQWVAEVQSIENAAVPTRSAMDTSLETSRIIILRLLQSVYHTLLAMQLLWTKSKSSPVFSPLELRHLTRVILCTLPALALGRAGLPPGAQSNLCALKAVDMTPRTECTCTLCFPPVGDPSNDVPLGPQLR
jgi:hypothetical protein